MENEPARERVPPTAISQSAAEFESAFGAGSIISFGNGPNVPKSQLAATRRQLWAKVTGSRRQRKQVVAELIRGGKPAIARFLGDSYFRETGTRISPYSRTSHVC